MEKSNSLDESTDIVSEQASNPETSFTRIINENK